MQTLAAQAAPGARISAAGWPQACDDGNTGTLRDFSHATRRWSYAFGHSRPDPGCANRQAADGLGYRTRGPAPDRGKQGRVGCAHRGRGSEITGLGAKLTAPLSLVTDRSGIYYDAQSASDLENLIAVSATLEPAEVHRAERLITAIIGAGLSKYNTGTGIDTTGCPMARAFWWQDRSKTTPRSCSDAAICAAIWTWCAQCVRQCQTAV